MSQPVAKFGGLLLALAAASAWGDDRAASPPGPAPGGVDTSLLGKTEGTPLEPVLAVDREFVRLYNRGDSKALAAIFTEDAVVVDEAGTCSHGRDRVEAAFAETFAADNAAKIGLRVEEIRFLTPETAVEEGRSLVTSSGGAAVSRFYLVIFVRRAGQWLVAEVREEPDPGVTPRERLRPLEWVVGRWVDEGADSVVRVDGQWSADGNFLIRTFAVKRRGETEMTVTQRIGWDPLARRVRSWEFDSEGGFGEGVWGCDGDRWVAKHTSVRPGGTTVSCTNVMVKERPDRVRWTSTDRAVGGRALPDEESHVLTRVPPPPGLGPQRKTAATLNTQGGRRTPR